jgi:hypothetical protein
MPHAATARCMPQMRLNDLREEHRTLDERLSALADLERLTSDEALEMRRLKKLKLRTKDAILAFIHMAV